MNSNANEDVNVNVRVSVHEDMNDEDGMMCVDYHEMVVVVKRS